MFNNLTFELLLNRIICYISALSSFSNTNLNKCFFVKGKRGLSIYNLSSKQGGIHLSFDYKLLGSKLREARENQQYAIGEITEFINKSPEEYQMIEEGKYLTLSGDTIVLLSKFLNIDYRFLVTGNYPSAESQIKELFRQNNELSKRDRRAIQSFIRLCETKNDIEKMLGVLKSNPVDYSRYNFGTKVHKYQGVKAARLERERLGASDGISNIYSLLRKQKVHIFRRTLDDRNISGVYIKHPNAGHCILINYVDDIYRQNFSTAHEYCHVLFDSNIKQSISFGSDNSFIEVRANNFASNFLLPQEALVGLSDYSYNSLFLWIPRLCKKYKVNKQVVIIALKEMNYINEEMKKALLNDKTLKISSSLKEDPELKDVSPNLHEPISNIIRNGISLEYMNLCRYAYQQDIITYSKLIESLSIGYGEGINTAHMLDIIMEV